MSKTDNTSQPLTGDNRTKKRFILSRRNLLRTAVYAPLALTTTTAYAQSNNLEIIHSEVPIKNLPPALEGFSIGLMSDFHAGAWGNEEVITQAMAAMRQLKPDLIALAGDFVDGAVGQDSYKQNTFDKSRFLFTELQTLRAEYGIYAVLGNHDHWADAPEVTRLLIENNITVLFDEHRILANGLILAGIDDYWTGSGNVNRALAGIEELKQNPDNSNNPVLLLSHNPDVNNALAFDNSVDLVLSGHTHGGQVRVPFTSWAPWVPCSPAYRGKTGLLRETAERVTFVSKGVGCFLVPMRISCPPDIALLRLKAV